MKIHQIRNATLLVDFGRVRLIVDPMLADRHAVPALRLFKYRGRNPAVSLPQGAYDVMDTATHGLITHFRKGHFDHLDRAGRRWLRARDLPVLCTPRDAEVLSGIGLRTMPIRRDHGTRQSFFDGTVQTTPCTHGRGLVGKLMEHGVGYFIQMPGEPTLLLTGDTILTPELRSFVGSHRPDVIVAPAGGARFDIGGEVIMNAQDMIELAKLTPGTVIANHIGAISHCPVTRSDVMRAASKAGIAGRVLAPADGECLTFN